MKNLGAAAVMLLVGCAVPAERRVDEVRLRALDTPDRVRRELAFQDLLRGEGAPVPLLRAALGMGAEHGFPAVALLYAQGRGDAAPLELRARHLAAFEWPADPTGENAVVEPYVRAAVEQDLARAGIAALPILARVLDGEAVTEAAQLRVARVMLRIGGRSAAREFARLLDSDNAQETAACALLYMGRQELSLRLASPEARVVAAKKWWELAADFPESEWIREAVDTLASRYQAKDPEGVRPVLEQLVGKPVEDPKAWMEENRGWQPAPAPLKPEELLPSLSLDRSRAYDANRRLEEATGIHVFMPKLERLSDLCSALRLWQPPADLEARWRRVLQAPLLRLSIAVIGMSPRTEDHRIRWAYETHFHPLEEDSGELRIETETENYTLFVQSLELGTRILASEAHALRGSWTGTVREFRESRPLVMFSEPFRAALVAVVEEVSSRRSPPAPSVAQAEWRARLSSWKDSPDALRALAYFQDPADLPLLRERKAGAALLLLGDPAALDLHPGLRPHEIDLALPKAEDPRVRAYLEALKR
ncbi:MAG TPA: hypothetical protein VKU80_14940 [Planctomycetota bacterium]|nr:hypothetical protein [Planctomycetota bacterium]